MTGGAVRVLACVLGLVVWCDDGLDGGWDEMGLCPPFHPTTTLPCQHSFQSTITTGPNRPLSHPTTTDDEPALPKRKLVSLWSMLVKNMELHKFQIQQVLYQQRAELAKRGTEIPDEHIG